VDLEDAFLVGDPEAAIIEGMLAVELQLNALIFTVCAEC